MDYDAAVLTLLSAPLTNDRSPRYMERALAAFHQGHHHAEPVTLLYAAFEDRVGLFVECADHLRELVTGPIAAHYPNCALEAVERLDDAPGWETWSADVTLTPELFPILRHAQFEDLLNGTFADPVSGILRAVTPTETLRCVVTLRLAPASRRRRKGALRALRLLDRDFFRHHHRLAEYYAEHSTRGRRWLVSWVLGILARQSSHPQRTVLDTTGSRVHDREDDLQAASGKIGGHLFETHIQLIVQAPPEAGALALDRLRQMAGALGAFTQSRLATFHARPVRRGKPRVPRGEGSLLSHEEIATLFHPPTLSVAAEHMQTMEFRELEPPPRFYAGKEAGAVTLGTRPLPRRRAPNRHGRGRPPSAPVRRGSDRSGKIYAALEPHPPGHARRPRAHRARRPRRPRERSPGAGPQTPHESTQLSSTRQRRTSSRLTRSRVPIRGGSTKSPRGSSPRSRSSMTPGVRDWKTCFAMRSSSPSNSRGRCSTCCSC